MKARIKFRKYGVMKFIGHLDVMRFFQKAMRRARIPIAFTEGFSPHMIMSFAQPLGVGLTSDGEYLDVELTEPISSDRAVRQLNEVMVEGMEIVSFVQIADDKKASGMTIVAAAEYEVTFLESEKTSDIRIGLPGDCKKQIEDFLCQKQMIVWKKSKKSEREVDIRPLIYEMDADVQESTIHLLLAAGSEENLKPDLVMGEFLKFIGKNAEDTPLHYHRLEIYAKNPAYNEMDKRRFVTLESLGNQVYDE